MTEEHKKILHSAEQGDPEAQATLGVLYLTEMEGAPDYKKAFEWLKKSADQGCALGQLNLGNYFLFYSPTKDLENGLKHHTLAAEQGNTSAQAQLGNHYLRAGNHEEALKWYTQSASQEHTIGLNGLRQLAEKKNTTAMNNLGYLYEHGIGVDKDAKQAVTYYKMAADLGDPEALKNLGVCYDLGIGVTKDEDMAVTLYGQANENGYKPETAQSLTQRKYGVTINSEVSSEWSVVRFFSIPDKPMILHPVGTQGEDLLTRPLTAKECSIN